MNTYRVRFHPESGHITAIIRSDDPLGPNEIEGFVTGNNYWVNEQHEILEREDITPEVSAERVNPGGTITISGLPPGAWVQVGRDDPLPSIGGYFTITRSSGREVVKTVGRYKSPVWKLSWEAKGRTATRLRRQAYFEELPIHIQLEALVEKAAGNPAKFDALTAAIAAIKNRYPKE